MQAGHRLWAPIRDTQIILHMLLESATRSDPPGLPKAWRARLMRTIDRMNRMVVARAAKIQHQEGHTLARHAGLSLTKDDRKVHVRLVKEHSARMQKSLCISPTKVLSSAVLREACAHGAVAFLSSSLHWQARVFVTPHICPPGSAITSEKKGVALPAGVPGIYKNLFTWFADAAYARWARVTRDPIRSAPPIAPPTDKAFLVPTPPKGVAGDGGLSRKSGDERLRVIMDLIAEYHGVNELPEAVAGLLQYVRDSPDKLLTPSLWEAGPSSGAWRALRRYAHAHTEDELWMFLRKDRLAMARAPGMWGLHRTLFTTSIQKSDVSGWFEALEFSGTFDPAVVRNQTRLMALQVRVSYEGAFQFRATAPPFVRSFGSVVQSSPCVTWPPRELIAVLEYACDVDAPDKWLRLVEAMFHQSTRDGVLHPGLGSPEEVRRASARSWRLLHKWVPGDGRKKKRKPWPLVWSLRSAAFERSLRTWR